MTKPDKYHLGPLHLWAELAYETMSEIEQIDDLRYHLKELILNVSRDVEKLKGFAWIERGCELIPILASIERELLYVAKKCFRETTLRNHVVDVLRGKPGRGITAVPVSRAQWELQQRLSSLQKALPILRLVNHVKSDRAANGRRGMAWPEIAAQFGFSSQQAAMQYCDTKLRKIRGILGKTNHAAWDQKPFDMVPQAIEYVEKQLSLTQLQLAKKNIQDAIQEKIA